eukprot:COSAG02_NODE_40_length_47766_cov_88.053119_19_plen_104_part_00
MIITSVFVSWPVDGVPVEWMMTSGCTASIRHRDIGQNTRMGRMLTSRNPTVGFLLYRTIVINAQGGIHCTGVLYTCYSLSGGSNRLNFPPYIRVPRGPVIAYS